VSTGKFVGYVIRRRRLKLELQTATALGRTMAIESERFADGGQQQVTTYSDQTQLEVTTGADLSCTTITTAGPEKGTGYFF